MVALEASKINWSNQPSFRDLGPLQRRLFWHTVQTASELPSNDPNRTGLKDVIRQMIVLPPVGEAPAPESIEKLIHFFETPENPTETAPVQE